MRGDDRLQHEMHHQRAEHAGIEAVEMEQAHRPAVAQIDDSLVVRTQDGLDRVLLEGYLGLIPDASTLRVIFSDGSEWAGEDVVAKISSRVTSVEEPGAAAT